MCGIFYSCHKTESNNNAILIKEGQRIKHRGPDNQDTWVENNMFLGHTRLSILDLSKHGDQPLISKSKRFVISFNGEIRKRTLDRQEISQSGRRRHPRALQKHLVSSQHSQRHEPNESQTIPERRIGPQKMCALREIQWARRQNRTSQRVRSDPRKMA